VNHAGDRTKLKDALVAKVAAGYSKQRAAELVARYANAKNNPLKLEGLPYKSEVTDRIVMRIADSEK
jgi:hypothetical protein